MSYQLAVSLKQILDMPYYKNEAARSGTVVHGHEDAIAAVLDQNGFDRITDFQTSSSLYFLYSDPDSRQSSMKFLFPNLRPGSYIAQPAGSNDFPDFLIHDFNDRFVMLEAKSGNGASIAWNDNLPKTDVIYVFSSGSHNETTIFLGQDVLDPRQTQIIDELRDEIDILVRKANSALMENDGKNRGWNYYPRPKFQQLQGRQARKSMLKIERVNYFKHPDRDECELRALEFAGA